MDLSDAEFTIVFRGDRHLQNRPRRWLWPRPYRAPVNRFGYWRDPLFLTCSVLYAINRWGLKPHLHSQLLHDQFNDLLLIPCALPLVLWAQRQLGLRAHDHFPDWNEILLHVGVWSFVCEWIAPRFMPATGDWKDVAAYAIGGWIAWRWWQGQETRLRVLHEL